jgi:hypothetical protein
MIRFRLPLVGLVLVGLLLAVGCNKKPKKDKPKTPVVQDMNIVKPGAEGSDSK